MRQTGGVQQENLQINYVNLQLVGEQMNEFEIIDNSHDKVDDAEFMLIVGDGNNITNASVPVRWCILPKFKQRLKEKNVKDPHVFLLAVGNDAQIMDKKLIPLNESMTYLNFHKPGNMMIVAYVIDGSGGRENLISPYLWAQTSWGADIFKHPEESTVCISVDKICDGNEIACITHPVHIPEGVFGEEPPKSLKWFINLWHENRPIDECQMRRRFIFAFTLKWIAVLVVSLLIIGLRFIGGLFTSLLGWPQVIKWKYIWRPFKYDSMMMFDKEIDTDANLFLWHRTLKVDLSDSCVGEFKYTSWIFMPFNPIVFIVWLVIGVGIAQSLSLDETIIPTLLITFAISVVVSAVVLIGETIYRSMHTKNGRIRLSIILGSLILFGAYYFSGITLALLILATVSGLLAYLFNPIPNILSFDLSEKRNTVEMLEEIQCEGKPELMQATYNQIPKKHRTLRLLFGAFKNKICKPMQF